MGSLSSIETKFPVTLEERLELGVDELRIPATFREFTELLETCDYQVEFQNNEIILMSIATDPHEHIVANILGILYGIYKGKSNYRRYGSNRHVFIPKFEAAYSPDASIVMGEPQIFEYAKGKTANLNPWLIVEVLSPGTRHKDWGEKLPRYKQIESLKHILFIEQDFPLLTIFSRTEAGNRWKGEDFDNMGQSFKVDENVILLGDIYENVLVRE